MIKQGIAIVLELLNGLLIALSVKTDFTRESRNKLSPAFYFSHYWSRLFHVPRLSLAIQDWCLHNHLAYVYCQACMETLISVLFRQKKNEREGEILSE